MKKLYALPLAVLFIAACSESTSPESVADLTPSYAKGQKGKPGGGGGGGGGATVTGDLTNATFDFNSVGIAAASGIGTVAFATEDQDNAAATVAAASIAAADVLPGSSNGYLGRFNNTKSQAVLNVGTGGSEYSVAFDLYIIGTWDGKGKQAQHGTFQANVFSVGYRCGAPSNTFNNIFSTTFSNQLTVQQDYPAVAGSGGGTKAATGAHAVDALGYAGRRDLTNIHTFKPIADTWYKLSFTGANPCGSGAFSLIFKSANPGQQNNWDESWAIDNVVIKTDA